MNDLPQASRLSRIVRIAASAAIAVSISATAAQVSPQSAFAAANDAAMLKMMQGMNIEPSGDVDHDFAVMMIAHHQGAIDMAQAQLRFGRDRTLNRIAQEIVVEQTQEIAAMELALRKRGVDLAVRK